MDAKERRFRNLWRLSDQLGDRASLARRIGIDYSELRQIMGKSPDDFPKVVRKDRRKLGEERAREWEKALHKSGLTDIDRGWLDREHEPGVDAPQVTEHRGRLYDISNEPTEFPLKGGAIAVDRLDVRASMGPGVPLLERETVIDQIRVPLDYIRANFPTVTSPNNLKIITGFGNSMEPTFKHGDPLIVDVGVIVADVDSVYVFAYHEELFIKQLQRVSPREFKVISHNRTVADPFIVERAEVNVIGRVVCAVNMNKIAP
jgi:hypothetical protein